PESAPRSGSCCRSGRPAFQCIPKKLFFSYFLLYSLRNKNSIRYLMVGPVMMAGRPVLKGHEGAVPAVQIVGRLTAELFEQSSHFLQEHASCSALPAVYHEKAVMSRLIIANGRSGMRFPDIIPGQEGAFGLSVFIQQARAENPA